MIMQRQFINLAVYCSRSYSYVLRRINCASLFHPEKQNGGGRTKQQRTMVEVAELPEPELSFDHYRFKEDYSGTIMLMPLGCNTDKILSVDEDGSMVAYDACLKKVHGMPAAGLKGRMQNSIPIGIGDSLYVINRCPNKFTALSEDCSFQALINGKSSTLNAYKHRGWNWHPLPLPPYVEDPLYDPNCTSSKISSCAVVGSNIWVSARRMGTYSFNTARRHWSKVGSWELPFRGSAEYVPELDRWFGFSSQQEKRFLCASDLMTAVNNSAAPTLCRVWEEELDIPEDWEPLTSYLVHVDSGRFCIARFFHVMDDDDDVPSIKEDFAIFTGMEVTKADRELQMAVHKYMRYNFDNKVCQWVF